TRSPTSGWPRSCGRAARTRTPARCCSPSSAAAARACRWRPNSGGTPRTGPSPTGTGRAGPPCGWPCCGRAGPWPSPTPTTRRSRAGSTRPGTRRCSPSTCCCRSSTWGRSGSGSCGAAGSGWRRRSSCWAGSWPPRSRRAPPAHCGATDRRPCAPDAGPRGTGGAAGVPFCRPLTVRRTTFRDFGAGGGAAVTCGLSMVDTMTSLHGFTRSSRIRGLRGFRRPAPPSAGAVVLPDDDEVLLDAPDDVLGAALVGAAAGDHAPAAALLAATRRTGAWERRDRYVRRLAAFARSRPEWLGTWRAEDPAAPDLLLVRAQLAVDRAWDSPARAELLREVSPLITAAARAEHRDPVPWRVALDHARGTRTGHRYFEEVWAAAVRRSPHHYGCHVAALRYL